MSFELLVRRATWAAEGVLALEMADPTGAGLPAWDPGAHIDLVLPSGLVRQFSLCGDLDDGSAYRIAVLREAVSRGGSAEIHDTQLVGRRLRAVGPRNRFALVDADALLFLAGGIGITPILPMLQAAERRGTPWLLVYGGRSRATMAFLDEIGRRRGGAVEVVPEAEAGLPDLEGALRTAGVGTAVYCCGPPGMIEAVEKLAADHLAPGALHVERFVPAAAAQGAEPAGAGAAGPAGSAPGETFEVELARTGVVLTVPPDCSILQAVLEAVPSYLYSCQEGYCGTCEAHVLAGVPEHRDTVLTEEEAARNDTMMICVGRSRSPRLVLDI